MYFACIYFAVIFLYSTKEYKFINIKKMLIMSFIMYLERQFLVGKNKCTSTAIPVV